MPRLIPWWAPWAICAALATAVGLQQLRVLERDLDISALITEHAQVEKDRALVAAGEATRVKNLQAAHAVAILENDDVWRKKLTVADGRAAERQRTIAGLRDDIKAFVAAGGQRDGEPDAIALARARDRLATLGAMVERSNGLLARAEKIIEQRNAEVMGLLAIIHADRAACAGAPRPAGFGLPPS